MTKKVRVRFAPSPTGGLHLGGVRTVLYNYLFAKQNGGDFIVRIEDTDQTRFVEGAEEYIFKTLEWCGLQPDESPKHGGQFAPYRQSERKESYRKYAEELVAKGFAYYAFDTAEELDTKRKEIANFQYSHSTRNAMKNSLTLSVEETKKLLDENAQHVVRVKLQPNEEIKFTDLIRGEVHFDTTQVDDKVLLKADGMPTYHLAVVVDDYAMQITHAFRGEEWLPSAPVHIFLWDKLFGLENMPQWAHLPLILKPDGNGKLSKRDGDRLGFPVFAMDWTNAANELSRGFKERGFLPEAFINMLAMLGWNAGTEQEIFTLNELIEKFSLERVHKGGAKFDYEKAKWFNHKWIMQPENCEVLLEQYQDLIPSYFRSKPDDYIIEVLGLVRERCSDIDDLITNSSFFFQTPETIDVAAIQPKWDEKKKAFFETLTSDWQNNFASDAASLEQQFKAIAEAQQIKVGELMLPLRIMLVGGKFGPGVFDIATIIGKEETIKRIENVVASLR